MSFNFPNSPIVGDVYKPVGGYAYIWNGSVWRITNQVSADKLILGSETSPNALLQIMGQHDSNFIELASTDAGVIGGPGIELYRNSPTPAPSDKIGYLSFQGNNSGPAKKELAYITVFNADVTPGSEDGEMLLGIRNNGAYKDLLYLWGDTVLLEQGRLQFPAAANPSTDVNTLDDYEEGLWTPSFTGSTVAGTPTYAQRVGVYVKIGQWVWATVVIQLSALGTAPTGNLAVTGLPFVKAASPNYFAGNIGYATFTVASATSYAMMIDTSPVAGVTQMRLNYMVSGSSPTAYVPATAIGAASYIMASAFYMAV